MKKTPLFASLMCVLISTVALGVGGNMGGTDPNGSPENPYLIEDLADFDTFADPANAATYWAAGVHTKLMTDIDLSGRTYTTAVIAPDTFNSGFYNDFDGIEFSGIFDGNNLTINNLIIDTTGVDNDYLGLFGWVHGSAEVKNLGIENIAITGGTGSDYVGGLGGLSYYGSSIRNCYSTGIINSDGYGIGGLVGENNADVFVFCYATCSVSGNNNVGGLVGYSYSTVTDFCYATGPVNGTDDLGGLMGQARDCTVNNCYATGNISGINRHVGGLIGVNYNSIVANCYAIGPVNGTDRVGGLMGWGGTVINSFWDVNTSGTTDGVGNEDPDPAGVEGKTTSEMQTQSIFTDWDFVTDWMMLRDCEDYPRLAWQEVFAGDIAGLYGADMVDFAYLANYWGLTGCSSGTDCGRADIDTSGDVGLTDLAAVANDWLK